MFWYLPRWKQNQPINHIQIYNNIWSTFAVKCRESFLLILSSVWVKFSEKKKKNHNSGSFSHRYQILRSSFSLTSDENSPFHCSAVRHSVNRGSILKLLSGSDEASVSVAIDISSCCHGHTGIPHKLVKGDNSPAWYQPFSCLMG